MSPVESASKTAVTAASLHPLLAERWSPRGFDAEFSLTDDDVMALLEAAQWSPSAGNSQPWRILPTLRGSDSFAALLATLDEGNRIWAFRASALLLMASAVRGDDGKQRRWAWYDAGQAATALTVQATSLGLSVHQMGGFDADAVRASFDLAAEIEPIAVLAVGRFDPEADLPDYLAERERAPRVRMPIAQIVLPS